MIAKPAVPVDLGAGGRDDRGWRLRHLPPLLAASGVVLVVAAAVGGLLGGTAGAAGAGAGVAAVAVGHLLSTLVIAWADSVAPALVMPLGMMAYLVKIAVIAGMLMAVAAVGWAGLVPMAWGIVAGVLAWIATHIWWLTTAHPRRTHP